MTNSRSLNPAGDRGNGGPTVAGSSHELGRGSRLGPLLSNRLHAEEIA